MAEHRMPWALWIGLAGLVKAAAAVPLDTSTAARAAAAAAATVAMAAVWAVLTGASADEAGPTTTAGAGAQQQQETEKDVLAPTHAAPTCVRVTTATLPDRCSAAGTAQLAGGAVFEGFLDSHQHTADGCQQSHKRLETPPPFVMGWRGAAGGNHACAATRRHAVSSRGSSSTRGSSSAAVPQRRMGDAGINSCSPGLAPATGQLPPLLAAKNAAALADQRPSCAVDGWVNSGHAAVCANQGAPTPPAKTTLLDLPHALLCAIAACARAGAASAVALAPMAATCRSLRCAALASLPRLCIPADCLSDLTRVGLPCFQGLTSLEIDMGGGVAPSAYTLAAALHAAPVRLPPRGMRHLTLMHAARGCAAAVAPLLQGLPRLHALDVVGRAGSGGAPGIARLLAQPPLTLASLTLRRVRIGDDGASARVLAAALAPLAGTLTELRLHSVSLDPLALCGLSGLSSLNRLSLVAPHQPRLQLQPLAALSDCLEDLELSAVRTGRDWGELQGIDDAALLGPGGGGGAWAFEDMAGNDEWETDSEGAWDAGAWEGAFGAGGGVGGLGGTEGAVQEHEEEVAAALGALRGLRRLRVQRLTGAGDAVQSAMSDLSALSSLDIDIPLGDPRPQLCWMAWSQTLRDLKVGSFRFTRPWGGPPLSALTRLEVSGDLSAPEAFLGGFAPKLQALSIGTITWANVVTPTAGCSVVTGAATAATLTGAAAAAAAAAAVRCSVGAVPRDCQITSLSIGTIRASTQEALAVAAAAAVAAAQPAEPLPLPAAGPSAATTAPQDPISSRSRLWWPVSRAGAPSPPPLPARRLPPLTVPSAALQADMTALLLRLTRCTALSVGAVESRAFARALPGAIALWTSLQSLRLECLPFCFDDDALRCTLAPHASTLTSLAIVNCRGVTWRGIEALGSLKRLRRLCVEQQTEVTTASVITAARTAGVTELRISQLSAAVSRGSVDGWHGHAAAAFAHAAHWSTATAVRDGGICASGSSSSSSARGNGARVATAQPPGAEDRPGVCESWEWWLGVGDAEAVARALPQLQVLVVAP